MRTLLSSVFFSRPQAMALRAALSACAVWAGANVTLAQTAEGPRLAAAQSRTGVRISWPATTAREFMLQSSGELPAVQWLGVDAIPEISGEEFVVIVPLGRENQFFRLFNDVPPETLPALTISPEGGMSTEQAALLASRLGIEGATSDRRGVMYFVDPTKFQATPRRAITDEVALRELAINEDRLETADQSFEAFDLEALRAIRAMTPEAATQDAAAALRAADLLPANAQANVSHTRLSLLDAEGNATMEEVMLDTHVSFDLFAGNTPLVGPGAKISISFDPEGKVSQMLYSHPRTAPGRVVPIIRREEAATRALRYFPRTATLTTPRLVYFCPSLLLGQPQTIIPHYEIGATVPQEGEEPLELLRRMIPATDDAELVPTVVLQASVVRTSVSAQASARSGTPPYSYRWVSSSADLSGAPETADTITYAYVADERSPERLEVIVTDANGVEASDVVLPTLAPGAPLVAAAPANGGGERAETGGVRDFGVERGVADMGSSLQNKFVTGFKTESQARYQFGGTARETDFRQGGSGNDHLYADNSDLTFYIGHGSPSGFTFEGNFNDKKIEPADVVGAWGNGDMEWLCLVSCQVLKWESSGKNVVQRWGPSFDKLHMILGFDTVANDWSDFGTYFAFYANGNLPYVPNMPAFPIRKAWFLAKRDAQPASNVAGAMGPIGPGGATNIDEYYHGQGAVGPDIAKAQIQGWWVLYYK